MLALIVVAGTLVAIQHVWPLPDHVAARVDSEEITVEALDVFVAAARRRQEDADRESVLKGLLENRLLADADMPKAEQETPSRVGYDRNTRLEQQLFRLIRSAYTEPLNRAMRDSGAIDSLAFLTAPMALDRNLLAPMLLLDQKLYSTMTQQQKDAAQQFVLARYRFRGSQEEQALTLWDLYRRQNMQLKVQMHSLNLDFIREAVKQQLTTAFVLDWFEHSSGLSDESRQIVRRCVEDALLREARLQEMGLLQDIHDDNPQLRALADRVTADEVAAYYLAHREEFTRVEKVHAYHIRLDSQKEADKVYAEIAAGLPFADAVERYSRAGDRNHGGALGWIDRHGRQDHWSRALAFVQPPNRVSRPFRSPQTSDIVYWEILLVDARETGYQPVESESVRYRASNAIARQKLQERFHKLLEGRRKVAAIRINRRQIQCESC